MVVISAAVAFILIRKRKARQNARSNLKPDPFTMGFGNDDTKYYNNNFPPQQNNEPPHQPTTTFDNYEVAAISPNNIQPTIVPATTVTAAAAATQPSLGSFVVIATYIPTLSDELEIETGDKIDLVVEYDDGWCQGINLSKGYTKGVFPRHCIDFANTTANTPSHFDVERSKRVSSMYQP